MTRHRMKGPTIAYCYFTIVLFPQLLLRSASSSLRIFTLVFSFHYSAAIEKTPEPSYFLAAPTSRTRPSWYLPLLPEIITSITKALRLHSPNLLTLKAFKVDKADLDSDGVHLNALSGMDYVLHLLNEPR